MPEKSRQFPHVSLKLTNAGTVPSGRAPRRSARSNSNLNNRRGHGTQMQSSASTIASNWKSTLDERQEEGLPALPNVPSLLIRVDPQSLDIDKLKSFDIEVILEIEDGFILGASVDADLTKLQQKIQQFINEQYGGGKVAEIWEILEGRFNRLEHIVSPDLLARWDQLLDDHLYIVEVSIACVGLNPEFSKYPEKKDQEDSQRYASRVARWTDKRDKTQQEWDDLQLERENNFENFVNECNGTLLDIIHAEARHNAALLPDSFSCRIEISGKGLKDIANNYPYAFDISEPEQVPKSLSNQLSAGEEPPFILEPPSPTAPKVCVIDSGIQESHRLLRAAIDIANSRSWIPGEINQTADLVTGGGHGTRVAGAVLYPRTIPHTGNQAAPFWIQNARVLDRSCKFPDSLYIPKVLNQIINDYHVQKGTRIFNHSITGSSPCRRIYMSAWATAIDHLSWRNDVLFIVASGNLPSVRGPGLSITRQTLTEHFQAGRVYPEYLLEDASRLANPAQSFQALTVGSIAHCTYNQPSLTSIAKEDHPSSFSCTGYGIWDSIKPEVVEYGGDFVQDSGSPPNYSTPTNVCPELVRTTIGGAPGLAADNIGTSFSAPKVAHIAAVLANNFPDESCLFYRALIVQSARLPSWISASKFNLSCALRMMGYGLPDLDRALGNTPNRITLITSQDTYIAARQAHIYQVLIPKELQSPSDQGDLLVEITLSYKAEPRRTRRDRRKYLSTWLDWECSKKGESSDSFLARILMEYEASEEAEESEGLFRWTLGQRKNRGQVKGTSRSIGTLQKDWAIVKSFDLRKAFCIAVVGHRGWNNDPTAQVPYSLVVSFEAINPEIPIYTSFVQAQIPLEVQQQVQVTV
jgi:hypothetical protein